MQALEICPATADDRLPIYRMLELYQHDLSDVWDQDLDIHGEYGYALDSYWAEPRCKPFVFRVGGRYAGFALVDESVGAAGIELWMAQFFVVKKYRRQGVGRIAAQTVFDRVHGLWEVGQMPKNLPAQAFWRRVIGEYTHGQFTEQARDDKDWHGVMHRFDNTPAPGAKPA